MDDDLSLAQQSTNRTATGTSVGGPLEQVTSRSTSRGRPMLSTGRGGAGNMREVAEANEQEWTGDEPAEVVQNARDAVERERSESRERTGREEWVTSGRGGQGNIRSRSRGRELDLGRVPTVQEAAERDEVAAQEQRDREVMERHIRNQQANKVYSTGRGEFAEQMPGLRSPSANVCCSQVVLEISATVECARVVSPAMLSTSHLGRNAVIIPIP